jgi:hypothetical protein
MKYLHMRHATAALFIFALICVASCKKNSPAANSWSFKGAAYTTYNCTDSSGILSDTSANAAILTLTFNSAPPAAGTYTVVSSPANPSALAQMSILLTIGASSYLSPSGRGKTVIVGVSSTGLVTVSGSGIELINTNVAGDSSAITLNVSQTQ